MPRFLAFYKGRENQCGLAKYLWVLCFVSANRVTDPLLQWCLLCSWLGTNTVHNLLIRDAGKVAWFISENGGLLMINFFKLTI